MLGRGTEKQAQIDGLVEFLKVQATYHEVGLPCEAEEDRWIETMYQHVADYARQADSSNLPLSPEELELCHETIRSLLCFHSMERTCEREHLKTLVPTSVPFLSVAEARRIASRARGVCCNLHQMWDMGPPELLGCTTSNYLECYPGLLIGQVRYSLESCGGEAFEFVDQTGSISIHIFYPEPEMQGSWILLTSWNCVGSDKANFFTLEVSKFYVLATLRQKNDFLPQTWQHKKMHTLIGSPRAVTTIMGVNNVANQKFFVLEVEGSAHESLAGYSCSKNTDNLPQKGKTAYKVMFTERFELYPALLCLSGRGFAVSIDALARTRLANLNGLQLFRSTSTTRVIIVDSETGDQDSSMQPLDNFHAGSHLELGSPLHHCFFAPYKQISLSLPDLCSFHGTITGSHANLAYLEVDHFALVLLTHFPGRGFLGLRKGCRVRFHNLHPLRAALINNARALAFAAGPCSSMSIEVYSALKSAPLQPTVRSPLHQALRGLSERMSFAASLWILKLMDDLNHKFCPGDLGSMAVNGAFTKQNLVVAAFIQALSMQNAEARDFLKHARTGKNEIYEEVLSNKCFHLLEDRLGVPLVETVDFYSLHREVTDRLVWDKNDLQVAVEIDGRANADVEGSIAEQSKIVPWMLSSSKHFGAALVGFLRSWEGKLYLEDNSAEKKGETMQSYCRVEIRIVEGHVHSFHLDHLYAIFDYSIVAEELSAKTSSTHIVVVVSSLSCLRCIMWDMTAEGWIQQFYGSILDLCLFQVKERTVLRTEGSKSLKVTLHATILPLQLSRDCPRGGTTGTLTVHIFPGSEPRALSVRMHNARHRSRNINVELSGKRWDWNPIIRAGQLYCVNERILYQYEQGELSQLKCLFPFQVALLRDAGEQEHCRCLAKLHFLDSPRMFETDTTPKQEEDLSSIRELLVWRDFQSRIDAINSGGLVKNITLRDRVSFKGLVIQKCIVSGKPSQFSPLQQGLTQVHLRSLVSWDTITLHLDSNFRELVDGVIPGCVISVYDAERVLHAGTTFYCRGAARTIVLLQGVVQAERGQLFGSFCCMAGSARWEKVLGPTQPRKTFHQLKRYLQPATLDLRTFKSLCRIDSILSAEFKWACVKCKYAVLRSNAFSGISSEHAGYQCPAGSGKCLFSFQVGNLRLLLNDGTAVVECFPNQELALSMLGLQPLQEPKPPHWKSLVSLVRKYGIVDVMQNWITKSAAVSSVGLMAYGGSKDPILRTSLEVDELANLETWMQMIVNGDPVMVHYRQQFRKANIALVGQAHPRAQFSRSINGKDVLHEDWIKVRIVSVETCSPLHEAQELYHSLSAR